MSERLDIWLVHHQWSATRTKAVRLIKNGAITVNGQLIQRPSYSVKETDQVTLQSEPEPVSAYQRLQRLSFLKFMS